MAQYGFDDQIQLFGDLIDVLTPMVQGLDMESASKCLVWFGCDAEGDGVCITFEVAELTREECKFCTMRECDFVGRDEIEIVCWRFLYDWSRHVGIRCPGLVDMNEALGELSDETMGVLI